MEVETSGVGHFAQDRLFVKRAHHTKPSVSRRERLGNFSRHSRKWGLVPNEV